jgi:hypothetical protein
VNNGCQAPTLHRAPYAHAVDVQPPSKRSPPAAGPLPRPRRPLPGPSQESLRSGGRGLLIAGPVFLLLAAVIVLVGRDGPVVPGKGWVRPASVVLPTFLGLTSLGKGFVMLHRGRSSAER